MGYAPKEIREVGIDDFPVSAKQQFFDLDRRLLGIPPRPVGVLFGWKIGFKACPRAGQRPDPGDRFQNQRCRCHADPIPHARDAQRPELAVGLRYKHSSDWLWPISLLPEGKRQFRQPSLDPIRLDVRKILAVDTRRPLIRAALGIGMRQNVVAADLVVQSVEAIAGFRLCFGV
jgi:hypothetical protein